MPYRGLSLLAHLLQGYLTLAWANTNLPALCLLQELLAYSFLVAVSLTSWNLTPHMDRPVQYKIQGDAMVALQSSVSLWPLLLYFFFFSPSWYYDCFESLERNVGLFLSPVSS